MNDKKIVYQWAYSIERIKDAISNRAMTRVPFDFISKHTGLTQFYVAGNCLNAAAPHDIDLFPVEPIGTLLREDVVADTRNATTYAHAPCAVQVCKYYHSSLEALVDSFDFAHIQVGARIDAGIVTEVYWSGAWVTAHAIESTWFTGSKYPLSSLVRVAKYASQGAFRGRDYIPSLLNILLAIIDRGVASYDDFKDQLDAVDLGIIQAELPDVDLMDVFNVLVKDKGLRRDRQ